MLEPALPFAFDKIDTELLRTKLARDTDQIWTALERRESDAEILLSTNTCTSPLRIPYLG